MSHNNISSNKVIARNAILLYIRMAISVVVGLYTGRVVLDVLGTVDYGLYGLVGGIVSMMTFINASMSGATSRFITYELGEGNQKRLAQTFSSAMWVHVVIALIVFILAETVGLWFLNNKLVVPENRMFAAHWVYQLSILSTIVGITQVPYNATLIAHEKMDIYAYMELVNVTLKLLIVFLLQIGNFDKLIFYSSLSFAVTIGIALFYRFYCVHHYSETKVQFKLERDTIKPMLSFSLWDLYGNCSLSLKSQGGNFLINMFFGLMYNAAASVAATVTGVVSGFSGTIIQAFRPHIIKLYAVGRIEEMEKSCSNAIKYALLLFSLIAVPVVIEADTLFNLWLVDVPPYAVIFCRLILITSLLRMINTILAILIHASGNIKRISLITGTIYWLHVPVYYIVFTLGQSVASLYVIDILGTFCVIFSNFLIAKRNIPMLKVRNIIRNVIVAGSVIFPLSILTYIVCIQFSPSFLRMLFTASLYISLVSLVTYSFVLDKEIRKKIRKKIVDVI